MPVKFPSLVGRKVTMTLRVALPARVKFPVAFAVSHEGTATDMVTVLEALFLMERVLFAVWFTVTLPKERFPVRVMGDTAVTPVPVAVSELFPAFEAMVMFAVKLPGPAG